MNEDIPDVTEPDDRFGRAREVYRFGKFSLDVSARRLTREGQPIELQKQAFDLLLVLVRRAPDAVAATALIGAVWPDVVVGEENLKQRIMQLRRALVDDARAPRYIETVRGWGYRFVATVMTRQETATTTEAVGRLEARELEGKARQLMYNFSHPGDLRRSAELWQRLLALQPDSVPALSGQATARALAVWNSDPNPELLERAEQDARKAIDRDDPDARALGALSIIFALRGLFDTASAMLEAAIQKDPDDPWILQLRARQLMDHLGDYVGAERLARKGLLIDSTHFPAVFQLGWALMEQERFGEAEEAFGESLALQPDFAAGLFGLSIVFTATGRFEDAVANLERALEIDPESPQSRFFLAMPLYRLGEHERALEVLEPAASRKTEHPLRAPILLMRAAHLHALERTADRDADLAASEELFKRTPGLASSAHGLAGVAALRGDEEQALAWLKTARSQGFHSVLRLRIDPPLDSLREHAEFQAIATALRQALTSDGSPSDR